LAAALFAARTVTAQSDDKPQRFTATAINMNVGAAGTLEIVVDKWSSDADRDKLMKIMREKGPDKLLDALVDMPRMGYIRPPDTIGWDVHFARRVPLAEGGERIVLVTDRPLSFAESVNQTRSLDYPFTVVELRLDRNGKGEGKISLATKIIADDESNIVTLENYDLQPVMLTHVTREH